MSKLVSLTVAVMLGLPAKPTSPNEPLTWLLVGYPSRYLYQEQKVAWKRYQLRLEGAAGCIVSTELDQRISRHNAAVDSILSRRYGRNWQRRLLAEAKAEYSRDTSLIAPLRQLAYLQQRRRTLHSHGNGLHLYVDDNFGGATRVVKACGYADTGSVWVQYYALVVDARSQRVIAVDEQIKPAAEDNRGPGIRF